MTIRTPLLLAVGAATGVLGTRYVRRRARVLTPPGAVEAVSDAVGSARASVRAFARDVRIVAGEREREIYASLGLPAEPAGDRPVEGARSRSRAVPRLLGSASGQRGSEPAGVGKPAGGRRLSRTIA